MRYYSRHTIGFFTLVAMALLGRVLNIIIRVRLMKHDTARDRIASLSRGSAEAWDTYDSPTVSCRDFLE
jgi:hypothetical protein